MKKIVILGCENSHAASFLNTIKAKEEFSDIEVIGVYSDETDPPIKLKEKYGVEIMQSYDEAVGKVDGVVITARDGKNHYKYAKPYLDSGVPLYIDKPISCTESEATEFIKDLENRGIRYTGGSCLRHDKYVLGLKADREAELDGKTLGGIVRAPLDSASVYGGFHFYAAHLIEIVLEAFGKHPLSVMAYPREKATTVVFRYSDYDVTGLFVENNYVYYAQRMAEKSVKGDRLAMNADNDWIYAEFKDYYNILNGGETGVSATDFLAPVFVACAIERSIKSGKEEKVNTLSL